MEIFDTYGVIIIASIAIGLLIFAVISLNSEVKKLEQLLEDQYDLTSHYCKESLDRFEDISKLRMELASLTSQKTKLQDELLEAQKTIKKLKIDDSVKPVSVPVDVVIDTPSFVVTEMPKEEPATTPKKSYRRKNSSKKK